ncbi:hypothetical protein P3T76_007398 [Phytophthora citrophthora]|uniref:Uncharacterized protein n=1 Tax=Phytophthora citrophthora TaxID=4793 RepID=A0AAD9GN58_9STRA|nr:hypothetical protein P3T76_007398 [Phytophthora citrophthora]
MLAIMDKFRTIRPLANEWSKSILSLPFRLSFQLSLEFGHGDLFDSLVAAAGEESYVDKAVSIMTECRKTLLDDRFKGLETSEIVWISFLDPPIAKTMPHVTPIDTPATLERSTCSSTCS